MRHFTADGVVKQFSTNKFSLARPEIFLWTLANKLTFLPSCLFAYYIQFIKFFLLADLGLRFGSVQWYKKVLNNIICKNAMHKQDGKKEEHTVAFSFLPFVLFQPALKRSRILTGCNYFTLLHGGIPRFVFPLLWQNILSSMSAHAQIRS